MPQIETVPKICPSCGPEFVLQRTGYDQEILKWKRENFMLRSSTEKHFDEVQHYQHEVNSLLKTINALESALKLSVENQNASA